ncbi:hypothetical protein O6H91_11G007900 [Diphasiastrum complanatum]|uniref:Uncharacterized protein n=1 Tax=Diphasiastrum complanatum TaxID=34168 RepID=A0ACC2C638_DIPCM|nr:hypothetical protein O6H91_11G007900 [Diphasiastrum complanatum]
MSLMNNQLIELPRKLRAPCLRTLLLGNNLMEALPDGFLTRLENLMVLDLSDNLHLKSLPSSIGSLKLLVHLNVAGTLLEKLPDSVSNLKRLENFNLAWCTQLKYLPKSERLWCLYVGWWHLGETTTPKMQLDFKANGVHR